MAKRGGKRAGAGRPPMRYRGHRITLYIDDEAYQIYKRQVEHMNMSLEYQRVLKARYGDSTDEETRIVAHKERLASLQAERNEALRVLEDKFAVLIESEAAAIRALKSGAKLEAEKEAAAVLSAAVQEEGGGG